MNDKDKKMQDSAKSTTDQKDQANQRTQTGKNSESTPQQKSDNKSTPNKGR